MEIFDSRYFYINKVFLKLTGLWIEQDRTKNSFIQTLFVLYMLLNVVPHYYGVYKNFSVEVHKTLVHLTSILYFNGILSKYLTTVVAQKKLTELFRIIVDNWIEIKGNDANELSILLEYSERGRTLTIFYITYLISALIFFVSGPLQPIVLDNIHPLENGTRPLLYILYGEYGIDPVKNYNKIFAIECAACIVSVIIICSVDTMYAACVEHCLALFRITKYRLQVSTKHIKHNYKYSSGKEEITVHNLVINVIKVHKRIIHFASQLESSYSMSFLFLIAVNGIYVTLLCVLIIEIKDDFTEQSRFVSILIGIVVHLFYLSWPGQKMINSSSQLFKDVYFNEWYKCSIRTQNLLRFMTLRCVVPCYLTAGGIYIMNFENFAAVVKTSVSYIAVFSSFT